MRSRLLPFAAVALIGFVVQVILIELLSQTLSWPLAVSTMVAVEVAVLHNFVWHEQWTWRHRVMGTNRLQRLAMFHATNGLTSITGNVAFAEILVRTSALNSFSRSVVSVALTGMLNFIAADRMVFRARRGLRIDGLTD